MALTPLAPALGALLLASGMGGGQAEAKTPGKTYCFYGKCHRVKTIAETEALIGKDETVHASHYDSCKRDRYNPCGLTSSGAVFDSEAPDNAASPIYPDGTTLLVRSPDTGVSLVLRVNNAGPYWGNRKLDVSRKAAEVLGFASRGVAKLQVRVIDAPTVAEATYKKRRVYDPVPGHIGQFASLDEAQTGAATAYVVAGLSSPFPTTVALGAGNPTQVAGVTGTQSGASVVAPTVLAAAQDAPVEPVSSVAASPVIPPVKIAGFVAMAEGPESVLDAPRVVKTAALDEAKPVVRQRSHAERTASRNSRSYRVAARQKKKREEQVRSKPVAVAEVRAPQAKRLVTMDGTNDMSMFSRHVYAGVDRLAAQEPKRRRPAYSSLARQRDANDG
ncbi:RlpA-like double-psi beta-barrel domain-containing protein [Hyphomicrobium sp.]|uniref:RlpA-like double-psi beta-barrel domain-containing protein n=1 Tax=Hyphomicrobium sp. TaxID=82 RepID=UPI0025BE2EB0|nr:RlpA-like double-psi beta-barrel domain-containing protein [Hyphomicrobium sp.]